MELIQDWPYESIILRQNPSGKKLHEKRQNLCSVYRLPNSIKHGTMNTVESKKLKGVKNMMYTMYDTTEGAVKVYREAGYEYYLDIDNRYDMTFDTRDEYEQFMESINADYVCVGED